MNKVVCPAIAIFLFGSAMSIRAECEIGMFLQSDMTKIIGEKCNDIKSAVKLITEYSDYRCDKVDKAVILYGANISRVHCSNNSGTANIISIEVRRSKS